MLNVKVLSGNIDASRSKLICFLVEAPSDGSPFRGLRELNDTGKVWLHDEGVVWVSQSAGACAEAHYWKIVSCNAGRGLVKRSAERGGECSAPSFSSDRRGNAGETKVGAEDSVTVTFVVNGTPSNDACS